MAYARSEFTPCWVGQKVITDGIRSEFAQVLSGYGPAEAEDLRIITRFLLSRLQILSGNGETVAARSLSHYNFSFTSNGGYAYFTGLK